jgi:methionyl-tRNA formyltransferase
MFFRILLFGRKNCLYSKKIRNFLKKNSRFFYYIETSSVGEKIDLKKIKNLKFDYIFSFRSLYIIKKSLLKKAILAPINFHPGPPEYRGVGCVNYALFNNEKFYGSTAHLMTETIDNGPIIDVRKFLITNNDNLDALLKKTYKEMFFQFMFIIKLLLKSEKNIIFLLKKNKHISWSKVIRNRKDLNKFYEIKLKTSKKEFNRKIIATVNKEYKPYIKFYGKKFFLI